MKELRFDAASGVWRVAFAFDPARRAVLLVAGDKKGRGSRRFYGIPDHNRTSPGDRQPIGEVRVRSAEKRTARRTSAPRAALDAG
jgi:Phage derived protein Gp49-like (DUF891)